MSQAAVGRSEPEPGEAPGRPPGLLLTGRASGPSREARAEGLTWWREILYAAAFYVVYSVVRNTQGSATVSKSRAFRNAQHIISVERHLGLFHEHDIQRAVLGARTFMVFWNLFYGTFHFVITIGVLVFLFRRFPERYRRWRNTLGVTTALALLGFALYPLMPPRLLHTVSAHYSYFVDTLVHYGSPWSFDSGTMQKLSNQYAAMPSLHFAWSAWCACALFPVLRRPWVRALAILYPVATLFAVVVTANHYILDAAGGLVVLGLGYLGGTAISKALPYAGARSGIARQTSTGSPRPL